MIKNILFDMGNVLLRFEPETFIRLSEAESEEDRLLLRRVVYHSIEWVKLDTGELDDDGALAVMLPKLPERLHAAARRLVTGWADYGLKVDGMEELVQEISDAGYVPYLLTNAAYTQRRYFPNYPVSRFFGERIFLSAEQKLTKPNTEYFLSALRYFALRADECVFIDDSPTNAEAAARCGIHSLVFQNDPGLLREELKDLGVHIS